MISIHQRVFISALIILCLFLGISAWFLDDFFKKHSETNMQDKLQNYIYSLLATAKEDQQGRMRLPDILADPKLNQPDSGIRAYVKGEHNSYQWFSASTISSDFNADSIVLDEYRSGQKIYSITETNYSRFIYTISWEDNKEIEQNYVLMVEINRQDLDNKIDYFRYQLALWLGGSAIVLLASLFVLLNWSLKPLRQGVQELKQIQQGEIKKMSNNYPQELLLLTSNINQLIELSIKRMQRYRNSLGDLSHSLKTPLAIIQGAYDSHSVEQLRMAIAEQLGHINELIEYQLQRASIAGESSGFSKIEITAVATKIIKSLDKVYIDKQIKCQFIFEQAIFYQGDEGDLMELLGNLLDNAYKYGNKNIIMVVKEKTNDLEITIEDDGPGIDKNQQKSMLQRGSRADTLVPGHGIGLGIVNDIIKQYKGTIKLDSSKKLQGLKVIITISKG